ncbi:MAG: serine/threonine-protein kinase [Bacteroidales bacterium]
MEDRSIGPYKILEEIGRGGMGVVYLADDTRLGRQVALKALPPSLARDAALRERLRREARAAAKLSHPGIATVHALEEIDDELFIVSEYVRGHNLRIEIERGPLAAETLVDTCLEIARALAAAHAKGVVHRDLKPENVMRSADAGVKVLDFGLAHIEAELGSSTATVARLTGDGKIVGTLAYMSPEQLLGGEVDFRTDIFSFGVMLYELATGVHPFEASDLPSTMSRILHTEPIAPSQLSSVGNPEVDPIVEKCLRKEPAQRYRSTADLVRDLERLRQRLLPQPKAVVRRSPGSSGQQDQTRPGLWWWKVHQVSAALLYGLMVHPILMARGWIGRPWGLVLALAVLVPMVVVGGLRLQLWFTAAYNPSNLAAVMSQVRRWVRAGDVTFVLALLASAAVISADHPGYTIMMVLFAAGCSVAFLIVEPATAQAALRQLSRRSGTRKATKSRSDPQKRADPRRSP